MADAAPPPPEPAPGPPAKPRASARESWRWLLSLARPYGRRLALGFATLVLSGGVSLVLPAVGGWVVDAALVEKSLPQLRSVILGLFILFGVNGGLAFIEVYTLRSTAALMLQALRGRLHAHLLTLTPAFFESQRTGDLLSRLGSDVDEIGGALTQDLLSALERVLVLVGSLAILLAVHRGLTAIMLLAVPPVVVAAYAFGMRFERLSKERRDAFAKAGVVAEESLSGIRTVQAFAREPFERARYAESLAQATGLAFRTARVWGGFSGVASFVGFSALALVLWYGGSLVVRGALTAGQLTSFLLYTLSVAGAIGSLASIYGGLKGALGATARVREILATPPAIADAEGAVDLPRPRGHVEFRALRFAYGLDGERRPALDGVTLEARPGEVLALVGPSGAGKSTLVSLLLRFYDPHEGAVLVDGVDLRRARLASLRAALGLVPQDIFLFGGTVAENIRYGRPEATDAEVRASAEAAQAHGFISALPQGYESVIGERGVKLSTGERQRIAIARVFLKDPAIVILDEATSSLDAESEHLVQRALERLMAGRTTLVIAHRLATVRSATRVALLERGAVSDQGTHDALFARNALYRRLCELQMIGPNDAP